MDNWISFKGWWFQKCWYTNRGLIDQIEAATKKDYVDITIEELENFIEELKIKDNETNT